MKKIQLNAAKLQLNKEKITSLTRENMGQVNGGSDGTDVLMNLDSLKYNHCRVYYSAAYWTCQISYDQIGVPAGGEVLDTAVVTP